MEYLFVGSTIVLTVVGVVQYVHPRDPPKRGWSVAYTGTRYRLTNHGGRARNVTIDFDGEQTAPGPRRWPSIDRDASIEFSAFVNTGRDSNAVIVTWDPPRGKRRQWSDQLPSGPVVDHRGGGVPREVVTRRRSGFQSEKFSTSS